MAASEGIQSKSHSVANWPNEVSNYMLEVCMGQHIKGKSEDNGFNKERWQHIVNQVNDKFGSGYDLDQCRTHFKNWKARFRALGDLQRLSGMGWNEAEGRFDAPQSVWKELKKDQRFWKDHKITQLYVDVAAWLGNEMANRGNARHPFERTQNVAVNLSVPETNSDNMNISLEEQGKQSSHSGSANRSRGWPPSSVEGGSAKKKKGSAGKLGSPLKVIAKAVVDWNKKNSRTEFARAINHEIDGINGLSFNEQMNLKEFFLYNKEKGELFLIASEEKKQKIIACYLNVYEQSNSGSRSHNNSYDDRM